MRRKGELPGVSVKLDPLSLERYQRIAATLPASPERGRASNAVRYALALAAERLDQIQREKEGSK